MKETGPLWLLVTSRKPAGPGHSLWAVRPGPLGPGGRAGGATSPQPSSPQPRWARRGRKVNSRWVFGFVFVVCFRLIQIGGRKQWLLLLLSWGQSLPLLGLSWRPENLAGRRLGAANVGNSSVLSWGAASRWPSELVVTSPCSGEGVCPLS